MLRQNYKEFLRGSGKFSPNPDTWRVATASQPSPQQRGTDNPPVEALAVDRPEC